MQLSDVTFQPVIFVLLFAYVFGSAMTIGRGDYTEFLVAGLFGMIIAQTAPGTTVGIATDMTTGVIDRFRSLPMSRSAVLAGRTMADTCTSAIARGRRGRDRVRRRVAHQQRPARRAGRVRAVAAVRASRSVGVARAWAW